MHSNLLQLAKEKKIIRYSDLISEKIPTVYLNRLVKEGNLIKLGRGIYALPETEFDENQTLLEVSHLVPKAVFCLLTALRFHNLTTQNPFEVWLAIDRNVAIPKISSIQTRIFRMTGKSFSEGIEEHNVEGGTIKVYSPAKTVADCFKYRNKIGLDVAIEALRDCVKNKKATIDEIWYFAKINRVANVIMPYLSSLELLNNK
jgi:predicted transcriptional regulator of viral defense system